jgi:hypothetical protein
MKPKKFSRPGRWVRVGRSQRHEPTSDVAAVQGARELLGVPADADVAEVTRAYWRQARRLHPDLCPDPEATTQFQGLQVAYRVALRAAHRLATSTPPSDVVPVSDSSFRGPGPNATATDAPVPGATGWLTLSARRMWPPDDVWVVAGPVHVRPARPPETRRNSGEGCP